MKLKDIFILFWIIAWIIGNSRWAVTQVELKLNAELPGSYIHKGTMIPKSSLTWCSALISGVSKPVSADPQNTNTFAALTITTNWNNMMDSVAVGHFELAVFELYTGYLRVTYLGGLDETGVYSAIRWIQWTQYYDWEAIVTIANVPHANYLLTGCSNMNALSAKHVVRLDPISSSATRQGAPVKWTSVGNHGESINFINKMGSTTRYAVSFDFHHTRTAAVTNSRYIHFIDYTSMLTVTAPQVSTTNDVTASDTQYDNDLNIFYALNSGQIVEASYAAGGLTTVFSMTLTYSSYATKMKYMHVVKYLALGQITTNYLLVVDWNTRAIIYEDLTSFPNVPYVFSTPFHGYFGANNYYNPANNKKMGFYSVGDCHLSWDFWFEYFPDVKLRNQQWARCKTGFTLLETYTNTLGTFAKVWVLNWAKGFYYSFDTAEWVACPAGWVSCTSPDDTADNLTWDTGTTGWATGYYVYGTGWRIIWDSTTEYWHDLDAWGSNPDNAYNWVSTTEKLGLNIVWEYCTASYKLVNDNTWVLACPVGQYYYGTNMCAPCPASCSVWSSTTNTLDESIQCTAWVFGYVLNAVAHTWERDWFDGRYFYNPDNWATCPNKCLKCHSTTKTLGTGLVWDLCPVGYTADVTTATWAQNCADGTYYVAALDFCMTCPQNCKTWKSTDNTLGTNIVWLTCNAGSVDVSLGSICKISWASDEYWYTLNGCSKWPQYWETWKSNVNTFNTQLECLTCKPGGYTVVNKVWIRQWNVGSYYYYSDNMWALCPIGWSACSSTTNTLSSSIVCSACSTGYALSGSTCVITCPNGQYAVQNNKWAACPSSWTKWKSNTNTLGVQVVCTEWDTANFTLDATGFCKKNWLATEYWVSSNQCFTCPSTWSGGWTSTSQTAGKDIVCTSWVTGVWDNTLKFCKISWAAGTYWHDLNQWAPWVGGWEIWSSSTNQLSENLVCTSCNSLMLSSNMCVNTCTSTQAQNGSYCINWPANCAACTFTVDRILVCSAWSSALYELANGGTSWKKIWTAGTYWSELENDWYTCPDNWTTCSSTSNQKDINIKCDDCNGGYELVGNKFWKLQCASTGQYWYSPNNWGLWPSPCLNWISLTNTLGDIVCTSCPPAYYLNIDNTCKTICNGDEYEYGASQLCATCPSNCAACYSSTNTLNQDIVCTVCSVGYKFRFNTECLKDCVDGYYFTMPNNWNKWPDSWSNCYSSSNTDGADLKCTDCAAGLVLENGNCVKSWTGATYYTYTTGNCESCPECWNKCTSESGSLNKDMVCSEYKSEKFMLVNSEWVQVIPSPSYRIKIQRLSNFQFKITTNFNTTPQLLEKSLTMKTTPTMLEGVDYSVTLEKVSQIEYLYTVELLKSLDIPDSRNNIFSMNMVVKYDTQDNGIIVNVDRDYDVSDHTHILNLSNSSFNSARSSFDFFTENSYLIALAIGFKHNYLLLLAYFTGSEFALLNYNMPTNANWYIDLFMNPFSRDFISMYSGPALMPEPLNDNYRAIFGYNNGFVRNEGYLNLKGAYLILRMLFNLVFYFNLTAFFFQPMIEKKSRSVSIFKSGGILEKIFFAQNHITFIPEMIYIVNSIRRPNSGLDYLLLLFNAIPLIFVEIYTAYFLVFGQNSRGEGYYSLNKVEREFIPMVAFSVDRMIRKPKISDDGEDEQEEEEDDDGESSRTSPRSSNSLKRKNGPNSDSGRPSKLYSLEVFENLLSLLLTVILLGFYKLRVYTAVLYFLVDLVARFLIYFWVVNTVASKIIGRQPRAEKLLEAFKNLTITTHVYFITKFALRIATSAAILKGSFVFYGSNTAMDKLPHSVGSWFIAASILNILVELVRFNWYSLLSLSTFWSSSDYDDPRDFEIEELNRLRGVKNMFGAVEPINKTKAKKKLTEEEELRQIRKAGKDWKRPSKQKLDSNSDHKKSLRSLKSNKPSLDQDNLSPEGEEEQDDFEFSSIKKSSQKNRESMKKPKEKENKFGMLIGNNFLNNRSYQMFSRNNFIPNSSKTNKIVRKEEFLPVKKLIVGDANKLNTIQDIIQRRKLKDGNSENIFASIDRNYINSMQEFKTGSLFNSTITNNLSDLRENLKKKFKPKSTTKIVK